VSGVHAVLTDARSAIGTPAYMAPEQREGTADARSDQYAFAVALLDAVLDQPVGRRRVEPDGDVDAALADVPAHVRGAISRALRRDPRDRFASIDDLLAMLAPPRRGRRIGAAIGGAIAAGAVATWLVIRPGPACTSASVQRWSATARADLVAAIAGRGEPFAAWTAERVAASVDRAVDDLGKLEVARCEGEPAGEPACLDARRAALDELLARPGTWTGGIARCGAHPPDTAALRAELRTAATAAATRAIGERARAAGDDALVADALEAATAAAQAAGATPAALDDAFAEETVGERSGDDAMRGRALVRELALQRWLGADADAQRSADALRAMLVRHGAAPRDELVVATAEAETFSDTGSAARALAAWDRAVTAATALGDADAIVRASAGRARAQATVRLDPERARDEAAGALALPASPAARRDAIAVAVELALDRGDAVAARHACELATRSTLERIRCARARGLDGDVAGGFAELDAIPKSDPATAIRIDLARALILRDGHREREALDKLAPIANQLAMRSDVYVLPAAERVAATTAMCRLVVELAASTPCPTAIAVTSRLHANAPARVAGFVTTARRDQHYAFMVAWAYKRAIAIMVEVGAPPVAIAELQWERARVAEGSLAERQDAARAARRAFAAAHRDADVAAIDDWLAR
jgi:hypothetical protein